MLDIEIRCQLLFERLGFRSKDVISTFDNFQNSPIDPFTLMDA